MANNTTNLNLIKYNNVEVNFEINNVKISELWDAETLINSKHFNIGWVLVLSEVYWDSYGVCYALGNRHDFHIDWINITRGILYDWDFEQLSSHPNLDASWLLLYSDEEWDTSALYESPLFDVCWIDILTSREWPEKAIDEYVKIYGSNILEE